MSASGAASGARPRTRGVAVAGAAVALGLLAACAGGPTDGPGHAPDDQPFAGLAPCDSAPFVAVFRGYTAAGRLDEKPGSTPASDLYGLRPDGSVAAVTDDLGTYEFGLSADGRTVFASPYPSPAGPDAGAPEPGSPTGGPSASSQDAASSGDTTTDEVVSIDTASLTRAVVLSAPEIGDVAPAPDASQLAVTTFVPTPPPAGSSEVSIVPLDQPAARRALPSPSSDGEALAAAPATRDLRWSPDGRTLALIATLPDATEQLRVIDVATGGARALHAAAGADGGLLSLDWSPDGATLLTVEGRAPSGSGRARERVVEVDVASGRSDVVLTGARGDLVYAAADGSRVMMLDDEPEDTVLARTWTRGDDGRFTLTSSAPVGVEAGLLSADRLDIPDCALR